MTTLQIVILAAGKGTRMGLPVPKVMAEAAGQSMVRRLLASIQKSETTLSPVIVTGFESQMVQDHITEAYPDAVFVHQAEQLGTGHAVQTALPALDDTAQTILVLYGDMPLVSAETMNRLAELQASSDHPLTMATVIVTNDELEKYFSGFSRVIRDADSRITRTIEAKDANEDELQICEVNPAFLCFDRRWLEENIQNLSTNNAQGELYLTDLIKKAFEMHGSIPALTIPVHEAYGANTPEQLARVEEVLKVA